MQRGLIAGAMLIVCGTWAFAQGSSPTTSPPSDAAAPAANPGMQPVAAGDHWTYEIKDEISGETRSTRISIVTDISKSDITTRYEEPGAGHSGMIVFDPSWDVVRTDIFRYLPNDGTGIRSPLTVGSQWKIASDVYNTKANVTFRRTGASRVTGRESITTKAGTFDTFVIETHYLGRNNRDPTLTNETSTRTWFSPDVDHWVKRNVVIRRGGHIFQNNTVELTEYGRKKS